MSVTLSGRRIKDGKWPEGKLYGGQKPEFEEVALKAVPYARWCNRTPGEMTVWMKEWIS